MALVPITTTVDELAKQSARQILNLIENTAAQIKKLRAEGRPAVAARAESVGPNGAVIPAQPAIPACTGAAIDTALGAANVGILNALSDALDQ